MSEWNLILKVKTIALTGKKFATQANQNHGNEENPMRHTAGDFSLSFPIVLAMQIVAFEAFLSLKQ